MNSRYIVVMSWMLTSLGLSGNELLCYALVYGHSQDGQGGYWGSLSHTAERLNISRRTAVDVLNRLVEKGHLRKSAVDIDGVQRCMYTAVAPVEAMPPTRKKERESQKTTSTRFVPPTIDEVREYCRQRGTNIDAQRFVDFYSANGWVQGRGKPIKDWRAAVRLWESKNDNYSNNGQRADKESLLDRRKHDLANEIARIEAEYCAAKTREADTCTIPGHT